MKKISPHSALVVVSCIFFTLAAVLPAWVQVGPRFEISFPASVHASPITGRVFVMISKSSSREPRLQVGNWGVQTRFIPDASVVQVRGQAQTNLFIYVTEAD